MPRLILFDDDRARLGPLGDLRASFEQRSGVFTALERAECSTGQVAELLVASESAALVRERTGRELADPSDAGAAILVNGRLATGGHLDPPEPGRARTTEDGTVTVAHLEGDELATFLADLTVEDARCDVDETAVCFTHPWDLLEGLADRIAADIGLRISSEPVPKRVVVLGEHSVHVHAGAEVMPTAILDATEGSILVEPGAVIRPYAVLRGPCAIGRDCVITDRALLKQGTVLGPACKVGGEVGSAIFQGYANKSHDGHLGDALVGEWVNIGAGTDNSNLLNTYAEVVMRLERDGGYHRTGRTFMGCVLGDHVKLAIGSRIMTGTTIGTGSMVASSTPPSAYTPRFSWLTDAEPKLYQWRKFAAVCETVMARRGIAPGPAYLERLGALHAASTEGR